MLTNGIFQIWHRTSKSGKMYTSLVAVDRFGKLTFNFDLHTILLAIHSAGIVRELNLNSVYEVLDMQNEFVYDFDTNELVYLKSKEGGNV